LGIKVAVSSIFEVVAGVNRSPGRSLGALSKSKSGALKFQY
jgi:hypothetical protein